MHYKGNIPDPEVKGFKPPDRVPEWTGILHALAATLAAIATVAIALQGCW